MTNQRIEARTALGMKIAATACGIRCIAAQPVYRFGTECDQPTFPQQRRCPRHASLVRMQDLRHRRQPIPIPPKHGKAMRMRALG